MIQRFLVISLFGFLSLMASGHADTFKTSAGDVRAEILADGLEHPWAVAFLPDGAFLVTERSGRMRIIKDGAAGEPIAGLPPIADVGQGGLLDVALAPDFEDSRRIFFTFSEPSNAGQGTAVARATLIRDGESGRLEDVTIIFRQNKFTRSGHHFGSRIAIARDGSLYVTIGDRGERDRAQDATDHAGSVFHINQDGTPIGADNAGWLADLHSIGHRNPQGAAIRPSDGSLWTVEHGARGGDEINRPMAGKNYGWPVISYGRHYSGFKIGVGNKAPGYEQPIYYWDPSIAPSGLAFYDGDLFEEWQGDLLVGALKYQMLVRLKLDGDKVVGEERLFEDAFGRIRDVRSGPDGAIYLLTDEAPGQLIRISPLR